MEGGWLYPLDLTLKSFHRKKRRCSRSLQKKQATKQMRAVDLLPAFFRIGVSGIGRLIRRYEKETPMSSNLANLIRKYYFSYESKDRKSLEDLLSDDFTFSSPLDDRISRTTYFQRCWPNSETISVFRIEKLFEKGNEAFVRYECERIAGSRFRNTEYLRIEGDKIKEVEVYFGSLPKAVLGK
jgi:ketosteroid isomerase-like protein